MPEAGPRPLHIALIAGPIYPVPPGDTGGTERVIAALAAALRARGHRVTLFAPADSTCEVDELVACGPSLAAHNRDEADVPPGVPGALEAITLDQVAARADVFDVLHAHVDFAHVAALRAHRHKLLTTLHWRVDQLDRALFWRYFIDSSCNAISHDQFARFPGTSCLGVVHHGLPVDALVPGTGPRSGAVFLGRMTDQKGPDQAIDIARAAGLSIRLAGDIDVGNPGYYAQAVVPRLAADASFIGPVDMAGKQALLASAEVLLMPIDWPEPFGLVMIEAMACGTPVVAARHGAAGEIIEDGVTGFVYDDPAEAPALVARARRLDAVIIRARFEACFSAERMADDYVALYRRLIAGRSSPRAF